MSNCMYKFMSSSISHAHIGIFHLYHPKHCDIALSRDQYKMCLGSKALSEASTNQLGLLAFKELQKQHEEYHKKKSLNTES